MGRTCGLIMVSSSRECISHCRREHLIPIHVSILSARDSQARKMPATRRPAARRKPVSGLVERLKKKRETDVDACSAMLTSQAMTLSGRPSPRYPAESPTRKRSQRTTFLDGWYCVNLQRLSTVEWMDSEPRSTVIPILGRGHDLT